MVFALLDLGSIKRVSIRYYKTESEVAMRKWIEELEVAAKNNDPDAPYSPIHRVPLKSTEVWPSGRSSARGGSPVRVGEGR